MRLLFTREKKKKKKKKPENVDVTKRGIQTLTISDKIPLSSVIKENSVSRNQVQVKQINK